MTTRFRFAALLATLLSACAFDGVAPSAGGNAPDAGGAADGASAAPDASTVDPPDAAPPLSSVLGHLVAHPVVGTPPSLDDDSLDDWANADVIELAASAAVHAHAILGAAKDNTVRVAAMHDATYLYLMIDVDDDDIAVDDNIPDQLGAIANDGVTLYFDTNADMAGQWGADDVFVHLEPDGFGSWSEALDVEGAVATRSGGYYFELRLLKSSMSGTLPNDLGFNLGLWDDDNGGPVDSFAQWYMPQRNECVDCCSPAHADPWCDTTRLGTLTLLP